MFEIEHYIDGKNRVIYPDWLAKLSDRIAKARIIKRVDRLSRGGFGDCKPVGEGVWELRIDYGPGYRVYYSLIGKTVVLLLCGGDKRKQNTDIVRAIDYLQDYKRRTL